MFEGLQEEIIERSELTTDYDIKRANEIKDALRDTLIGNFVELFKNVLESQGVFSNDTVSSTLGVLSDLIAWNLLDYFHPLRAVIMQHLLKEEFRAEAFECLFAMVHKGQEYGKRLELLRELNMLELVQAIDPESESPDLV